MAKREGEKSYWGIEKKFDRKARGLKNLGDTCYLNSVLQALSSCSSFLDYISKLRYEQVRGVTFASQLKKCLNAISSVSHGEGPYEPKEIWEAIISEKPDLRENQQVFSYFCFISFKKKDRFNHNIYDRMHKNYYNLCLR